MGTDCRRSSRRHH